MGSRWMSSGSAAAHSSNLDCGAVAPHRGGEPRARAACWGTLSWFSAGAIAIADPAKLRKRLTMAVGQLQVL